MIQYLIRLRESIFKDKRYLFLVVIFLVYAFLRFYAMETKSSFSYDQVDNAWAAKSIIVDHKFPLMGPENKLGSGIFVGPLYYYFVSVFYFFTNLDPIASGLIIGFTSIISFFTLFFITKKLFSFNVALIATFINTFSYSAITLDRVQWEVNFIPIVALFAFYFLYKILQGNEKCILYLSIILAISFHIHLTAAVFLPIITLLTLPFFPKTKKTLLYIIYSIPILLLGLSPIIYGNILNKSYYAKNQMQYAGSSFHGLHLTRVLQLLPDAFIQIESYIQYPIIKFFSMALLPIFFIIHFLNRPSQKGFTMVFLAFLFFIVPWLTLSTYNHEITNYYFSVNRFVGLAILSYLIYKMFELKKLITTSLLVIFALYIAITSTQKFLKKEMVGLRNYRIIVTSEIKEGRVIKYELGNPLSYIYYAYTRKK